MRFRETFTIATIVLGIFLQTCDSERILFFFGGGTYSHKSSTWPWLTKLADRSHEVTVISGIEKTPSEHPNIRDVVSKSLQKSMMAFVGGDRFQQREKGEEMDSMYRYTEITHHVCVNFLESLKEDLSVAKLVLNGTYDLIVVNAIFGECGQIFVHHLGTKSIIFDSTVMLPWYNEVFGFHPETQWIPNLIIDHGRYPMRLFDRFINTLRHEYWIWDRFNNLYPMFEETMGRFFALGNPPSFVEIERNACLILVNSYPATDFAHSFPPNIIQIGGLQAEGKEKPIPQVYQEFMDAAGQGGVVLISFGSTIDFEKVPQIYHEVFFKVIESNKDVRFLLRWKGPLPEEFKGRLNNLLTSEWLPQKELLRHPKMKVFITHGGLNSVQEATSHGIPLIVLPLFADQDYNGYRVHAQKVGVRLEIRGLDPDILQNALNLVLHDPQYKANVKKNSLIYKDRPQSAVDTAVFWTEFALRHDDCSTLRPQANHLRWYQSRQLDIFLIYFLIIAAILTIFIFIVVILLYACFTITWGKKLKHKKTE